MSLSLWENGGGLGGGVRWGQESPECPDNPPPPGRGALGDLPVCLVSGIVPPRQGGRAWRDLGLGPGHRVHPSRAPTERRNGRIMMVAGWGCRLSKVLGLSGNGSKSLTLERKGRPGIGA